jgi:hypothetical protein
VSKKECALPISVLRKDDYHGTLLYLFQTSFHKLLAILSCCSCFVALAIFFVDSFGRLQIAGRVAAEGRGLAVLGLSAVHELLQSFSTLTRSCFHAQMTSSSSTASCFF